MTQTQYRRIRIIGQHHALYSHGEVLPVTDNEAQARVGMGVFRGWSDELIKKGEAEVADPIDHERVTAEFVRQDALNAHHRSEQEATAARLNEEQAQRAAADAERRRELAAWFEGLSTDDMHTVLSWDSGEQDARRRGALTKFNALPTDRQQALIERATGGR